MMSRSKKRRRASHGALVRFINDVALPYTGNDCLLWPYAGVKGYGVMNVDGRSQYVHRLICERIHGPPPTPQHEAAHGCGVTRCCTQAHLSWKTHAENQADKVIHGTQCRGESHGRSKLTEDDVREIRRLSGSMRQKDIAARYGITSPNVFAIVHGKTWSWLK